MQKLFALLLADELKELEEKLKRLNIEKNKAAKGENYTQAQKLVDEKISIVSSTVGSSTCTGVKRRSKAASFSMYFLYAGFGGNGCGRKIQGRL